MSINNRPLRGDVRGNWQCTFADASDTKFPFLAIWERNGCGIRIYERHIEFEVRFMISGDNTPIRDAIGGLMADWNRAVEAAIKENNKRVNLAKEYLRDNDYCD